MPISCLILDLCRQFLEFICGGSSGRTIWNRKSSADPTKHRRNNKANAPYLGSSPPTSPMFNLIHPSDSFVLIYFCICSTAAVLKKRRKKINAATFPFQICSRVNNNNDWRTFQITRSNPIIKSVRFSIPLLYIGIKSIRV